MQKLQAEWKRVPARSLVGTVRRSHMGVGPSWFGGVVLAELTPNRPKGEALFVMSSCQCCFSHVPQRGAVEKVVQFGRQFFQVFLNLELPKMMHVSYVVGVHGGCLWLVKGQQNLYPVGWV